MPPVFHKTTVFIAHLRFKADLISPYTSPLPHTPVTVLAVIHIIIRSVNVIFHSILRCLFPMGHIREQPSVFLHGSKSPALYKAAPLSPTELVVRRAAVTYCLCGRRQGICYRVAAQRVAGRKRSATAFGLNLRIGWASCGDAKRGAISKRN